MVSSRLNDFRLKGYLRALAEAEFPDTRPSKAFVQDWALNYDDFPKSKTISREKDKDATDGCVIRVAGETKEWSLTCPLNTVLALDRGKRYRMRARIKMQSKLEAPAGKPLLEMGVFDHNAKKNLCGLAICPELATGAYEWYDFGDWTDEGHKYTLHMDPHGSTFSFDCIEIIGE